MSVSRGLSVLDLKGDYSCMNCDCLPFVTHTKIVLCFVLIFFTLCSVLQ